MRNDYVKPTVKAEGKRYVIHGQFHTMESGTPVMEGNELRGVTKPRHMTYIHSYGSEATFFQALTKGRLLATRCDNKDCEGFGDTWIPFRIACPDCLKKNTVVDVTNEANKGAFIHTFITTERTGAFNALPTPIRFLDIEIPGCATILKSYMSGPGQPDFNKRVIPIFNTTNPTYTINDLSWVQEGTTEADLPKGFTFSKEI